MGGQQVSFHLLPAFLLAARLLPALGLSTACLLLALLPRGRLLLLAATTAAVTAAPAAAAAATGGCAAAAAGRAFPLAPLAQLGEGRLHSRLAHDLPLLRRAVVAPLATRLGVVVHRVGLLPLTRRQGHLRLVAREQRRGEVVPPVDGEARAADLYPRLDVREGGELRGEDLVRVKGEGEG